MIDVYKLAKTGKACFFQLWLFSGFYHFSGEDQQ